MKIVLNRKYGGFSLSFVALKMYYDLKGIPIYFYKQAKYKNRDNYNEWRLIDDVSEEKSYTALWISSENYGYSFRSIPENFKKAEVYNIDRADPDLIKVVENLGSLKASGTFSWLEVVEIPDDVDYYIDDRDGIETVHAKHEYWPKDVNYKRFR